MRLSVGVEGKYAAYNSREKERRREGGAGETGEGDPPVSTPLSRGERHDINEHANFREGETKI